MSSENLNINVNPLEEKSDKIEFTVDKMGLSNPAQMITKSCVEAAYFKYAVNTFLAMKVTFMNQLKEVIDDYGGSYNQLSRALAAEYRLGNKSGEMTEEGLRELAEETIYLTEL